MMDPTTTKYMIKAGIITDGVVDKPDIVGAIFGQTEGLLGDELDLRDLQKSGKIGRIEVEITSKKGKTEGTIEIPSSLDQVETAIMASALETIDRVGPCTARITVGSIEDVRVKKREKIIERAKELLARMIEESKSTGTDLTESVRQHVQVEEITTIGPEKCPAGPNVENSDAIIIVEGRADVLNLLKAGIKNAVAVGGTNVPKTVQKLSEQKVVTAFVDGDRGGEMILNELLQVAELDFIARAPRNQEVEELTSKQIMKALRNKMPADQYIDMHGLNGVKTRKTQQKNGNGKGSNGLGWHEKKERNHAMKNTGQDKGESNNISEAAPNAKKKPSTGKGKEPEKESLFGRLAEELKGTSKAYLLDSAGHKLEEIRVKELQERMKGDLSGVDSIIFDGVITQKLLDMASKSNLTTLIATKTFGITKQPENLVILTFSDLN